MWVWDLARSAEHMPDTDTSMQRDSQHHHQHGTGKSALSPRISPVGNEQRDGVERRLGGRALAPVRIETAGLSS
ncbi:hypothetical protein MAPG_04386 [Magnaporthiopsis poae ATCC 64411]|uniref:Uncharacterized protein n=1 Tax=Magnaporthiopsis poae (strain ATCC 64411 / 73-15) TaxID=644358 RepID=A0A0C4DWK5_MAGP6|nr:hypothetical protein MAPG_04386 [Magnaporthiopsis poae ATCC 64411]